MAAVTTLHSIPQCSFVLPSHLPIEKRSLSSAVAPLTFKVELKVAAAAAVIVPVFDINCKCMSSTSIKFMMPFTVTAQCACIDSKPISVTKLSLLNNIQFLNQMTKPHLLNIINRHFQIVIDCNH